MTIEYKDLPYPTVFIESKNDTDDIISKDTNSIHDKINYDNIESDTVFEIDFDSDSDSSIDNAGNNDDTFKTIEELGLSKNSTLYERLKVLFTRAFPIVISFFLGLGGGFFNLMFAGSYSVNGDASIVFAGVSLANMFCNVSFLSLVVGLSTAMETLGSQHNGAGNYREVGITLQKSILVISLLAPPIVVIWYNCSYFFFLIGIEKDVCEVIKNYIRIKMLSIPIEIIDRSYEKYLMSIGVVQPSMWENISFNLMILIFGYLFVYIFKFNYTSLAWSWVLSQHLAAIVHVGLSLRYKEVLRTLQPISKDAFVGLLDYIKLGLPGTVMLCSEWWAYECLTMFASFLGTDSVAAQAIIIQTASLCFMIPLGLGIGTASLVGNALGAGEKELAKQTANLSIKVTFFIQSFVGLIILFFGHYFVNVFTKDKSVRLIAANTMPFLSVFTLFDAFQGVCSGILRGTGKQMIGAVMNVFAFYCIGLPMAWIVCFNLHFGVNGLMMGISTGTAVQVMGLLVLIYCYENYVFTSVISKSNKLETSYSQLDNISSHGFDNDDIVEVKL